VGSINLAQMVHAPFTPQAYLDEAELADLVCAASLVNFVSQHRATIRGRTDSNSATTAHLVVVKTSAISRTPPGVRKRTIPDTPRSYVQNIALQGFGSDLLTDITSGQDVLANGSHLCLRSRLRRGPDHGEPDPGNRGLTG
jgi:hypothetical protein